MSRTRRQVTMLLTVSVPSNCGDLHARREVHSLIKYQANFSLDHKDVVPISVKPDPAKRKSAPPAYFPFPEFEPPEELIELMADAIHNNRGLSTGEGDDPFRPLLWEDAKAEEYAVHAGYARDLARAAANAINARFLPDTAK